MLEDATKPLECAIRARPVAEPGCDSNDYLVQVGEVAIVQAATADQFPDPLDRIEFGAVGWQEVKAEREWLGGAVGSAGCSHFAQRPQKNRLNVD